ncbi:HTH-type transcriptional regulator AcrR [Oxobacter pfennigii]|uniref:HTH-type transcriptional regulator AcrR n=1 Tax=Oxobacter pfennigii TaxID=36849 RepID=A0A0P9AFX6_9CLOT|nr:TetR/AcrR family transcriptional regulator [Oxobacter pfennigii]KPU44275.1 HTH-type transcriptional regulator AcrR [Oxobacter pfennigii]
MNNLNKKSNTENRRKLIEAAKKLFYEQGYKATTLAQISNESKVNNGLITYYFGSKADLASEIMTEYMLELRNSIAKQLYIREKSYSLDIGIAVENRVNLLLKLQNPKLLNFDIESSKEIQTYKDINPRRDHFYALQKRLINPNISDLNLRFYEVCGISVTRSLGEAYASGFLKCDVEEIADYAIRMLFHMLELPVYQIEALVEQSRFLAQRINIKIGQNFEVISETY